MVLRWHADVVYFNCRGLHSDKPLNFIGFCRFYKVSVKIILSNGVPYWQK